jgi:hypothetical protein
VLKNIERGNMSFSISECLFKFISWRDCSKAQQKFFFRVGADPEAVYNICSILKIILRK